MAGFYRVNNIFSISLSPCIVGGKNIFQLERSKSVWKKWVHFEEGMEPLYAVSTLKYKKLKKYNRLNKKKKKIEAHVS